MLLVNVITSTLRGGLSKQGAGSNIGDAWPVFRSSGGAHQLETMRPHHTGDGSSGGEKQEEMTALQRHVAFFDRDGDGVVYPWETYAGFRALGFNLATSFTAMFAINSALSYQTLESWIPSPALPIYVKNIHRAKHGSDTGIYDQNGQFVPAHFERMFESFASTRQDKLSYKEIMEMTTSNQDASDFFGWTAAKLEWTAAYNLIKDEDGYASKEAIRGIYDGSLFYNIEKARAAGKQQ